MKKISLLLILSVSCFKGICQYLPSEMKEGLKGNVETVEKMDYDQYPQHISSKTILKFDKQGHFIKAYLIYPRDEATSELVFQYIGNRLLSFSRYIKGKIQEKTENTYNNSNQVISQVVSFFYTSSPDRSIKRTYSYDKDGFAVKVYTDQHGVDIRPFNQFFTYDKKGQKISEKREAHALSTEWKRTFRYNNYGDLIMEISKYTDNEYTDTTCYKYNYDKTGNWLKKQEFQLTDGKQELRDVTTRKITYFKK